MPDDTIINGSYGEWACTKNGEYDIQAVNSEGILTVRHLVINCINAPATVTITSDKDDSTKWTNKPVTVNISATNADSSVRTIFSGTNLNYKDTSFTNGYPYAGKKFRIQGTIYNALTPSEQSQIDVNASVMIRAGFRYTDGQTIAILGQ